MSGCTSPKGESAPEAAPKPSLRLAVITDLKGYLEPCGCTSRPLGGIDRMAAKIRSLRDGTVPLVVLMGGDLFFDTGELEPKRMDQATRNAKTLVGILNGLQVAAALPGSRDRAQRGELVAELDAEATFPWLAMKGDAEVVRVDASGLRVAIVGVRPGADIDAVRKAVGMARTESALTVAIVVGTRRDANRVAAIDGVDFVVQGGLDEDDPMPPHQSRRGWVLHASRQGQGVAVVDVFRNGDGAFSDASEWSRGLARDNLDNQIAELSRKIEGWKRGGADPADLQVQTDRLKGLEADRRALDQPVKPSVGNSFSVQWVELDPDAPTDPTVTGLMRAHDKAVNDANREAFADLKPPPLGPGDIAFVGSKTCSTCHGPAYAWWQAHPHGRAYETLVKRDKQYNLDCVGCHVTGYNRPGGSTVTSNLDGALVDVGCESCHGPGASHIKNPTVDMVRNPPESYCVGCHNEEHSDQFDYETYRKTVIVPGHGLPTR